MRKALFIAAAILFAPLSALAQICPPLTGDVTINGATCASTVGKVQGVTVTGVTGTGNAVLSIAPTITGHPTIEGVTSTGATGTGKYVFDGSPTLVTPVIGAATGTSLSLSGTGTALQVSSANSGAANLGAIVNTSNTASSAAELTIQLGGSSAGNAFVNMGGPGIAAANVGIVAADSFDFEIANVLGTTPAVRITLASSLNTFRFGGQAVTKSYTVSTLPTGITGGRAHVTDAVACTFLAALTGGSSTVCPVFYNGTAWVGG